MKDAEKQTRRSFLQQPIPLPLVRKVSCDGCGACCMHMGFPPFAPMFEQPDYLAKSDPQWLALRESHPELAAEALQGAKDNRGDQELPCVWLDLQTRQCRHYEHRPDICREFEMGSPECLDHRERRGIV